MFHLFDTCHSNKEAGTISEKRETVLSCCVFVSLFSYSKMAEAKISVDQNEFICPVCLDLLKDPVVIPCGHSYCKSCITDCWDQEDEKRVYSFPQCRQTFSARPALAKSTMRAEVVDKLKKAKLFADCYAGAGDVQCDVCTGKKYKAVKSCLVCQETCCHTHFDRHEEFHSRKTHKVIDATGQLQDMICRKHDKQLEMYCITDQQCICVLCKEYEHKNHKTVSSAAQRTEKQYEITGIEMNIAVLKFCSKPVSLFSSVEHIGYLKNLIYFSLYIKINAIQKFPAPRRT